MEQISLSVHTGSHIDAPLHKLSEGASIDEMDIGAFIGPAVIADLRDAQPDQPLLSGRIRQALMAADLTGKILLLATGWGHKRARTKEWQLHPPFLAPEAAKWLVRKKVKAVGIDTHSIGGVAEPFNSRTHRILLRAGVWVTEQLRFPESVFRLKAPALFLGLPIHLKGCSGAFCRPVLMVDAPQSIR